MVSMMSLKVESVTFSDILGRHQPRNLRSQYFLEFLRLFYQNRIFFTPEGLCGAGRVWRISFQFFPRGVLCSSYPAVSLVRILFISVVAMSFNNIVAYGSPLMRSLEPKQTKWIIFA